MDNFPVSEPQTSGSAATVPSSSESDPSSHARTEIALAEASLVAARDRLKELPHVAPWSMRQQLAADAITAALTHIDDARAALEFAGAET